MKKYSYLIIIVLISSLVLTGCFLSNVGQVPATEQSGVSGIAKSPVFYKSYDNVTLSQWVWNNFPDVWDLTQCDLTLSYTINMSGITAAGWAVTEVGLREVGSPNIDPNLKGGWMQSNYIFSSSNPNSQNLNDFHLLSVHGWDPNYQEYDAEGADTLVTPYWSGDNYGFWFDRDGVDEWQAELWGASDGGTYNTLGVYEIVITYHAIDLNTGTMFATINGVVQQGLYIGGGKDAEPEFYPAGRSFTGDMTQMQVFYGRGGGDGTVTIYDITVNGCLRTIVINGCYTGVADVLYDSKLISVHIQEIYGAAKNHGQFVRGVAVLTNDLMKAGIITGEEKGKIQSCAAQANQLPKEDGLVLWLDAGKGITAPVNGNPVSMWEDQSGNGNHAVQEIASFKPIYVTNELNGNPVVRFPGGEKYLRHSPILTDSYTAFYVLMLNESAKNLLYYYHAGNVNQGDLGFFAECMNKEEGWGSVGNVDTSVTVRTSEFYQTPLDWRIHTHQPEALYKDGVEVVYGRDDNVYAGGLTDIGSRSDHLTLFFVGDIAEILVYDRILTVLEREMVEAYLNAKYDIY